MAAKDKKVLYTPQEIYPYLLESDLAHVARYLPEHVQNAENNIRIFMPRYGLVSGRRNQLHEAIRLSGINVIVDDHNHPLVIKVTSIPSTRIQVYFIDNVDPLGRKSLFDPPSEGAPGDSADRSTSFIRDVLEAIKSLHRIPDVIHYLGWFSAPTPVYLKVAYKSDPYSGRAKMLLLVDGSEEEDEIGEDLIKKLELDKIVGDLLDPLQGEVTPDTLRRMTIHHSDGVIPGQGSASPELIEYLRSEPDHKVLEYPGPAVDHAEAYVDSYRSFTE